MVRLLAAIALLLAVAIAPGPFAMIGIAALVALLVVIACATRRLSLHAYFRRLLWLEPMLLGLVAAALLRPDGGVSALPLLARGSLSVAIVALLAATTAEADLLRALERLRLPQLFVTSLALAARYRPLVIEEATRLNRARRSRTVRRSRSDSWRGGAEVIGQLFVRTSLRAERLYDAMRARGWRE